MSSGRILTIYALGGCALCHSRAGAVVLLELGDNVAHSCYTCTRRLCRCLAVLTAIMENL